MRKPLLITHMQTQQHHNFKFIHNKPDLPDAKDNNNLRTIITNNDAIATEDEDANDIIYLSVNDKGYIENIDEVDDDNDDENDDDEDGGEGYYVSVH